MSKPGDFFKVSRVLDEIDKLAGPGVPAAVSLTDRPWRILHHLSGLLNSRRLDLETIFSMVLEAALELTGAQRGLLLLLDEAGDPQVRGSRNFRKAEPSVAERDFSRSIVREVLEQGRGVFVEDTSRAESLAHKTSVLNLGIQSVLCVPLNRSLLELGVPPVDRRTGTKLPRGGGEIVGALYVDSTSVARRFRKTDLEAFEALANYATVAITNAALYSEAVKDPLTSLFVRRYFERVLREELRVCQKAGIPLSLLMLDVDNFRKINEAHGHAVGDEVLAELGTLVRKQTRTADTCARYGGEEFVILLPGLDAERARELGERLRSKVTATKFAEPQVSLTLSIGIAASPPHALSAEELVRKVDQALGAAKETGRDRITIWHAAIEERPCRADKLAGILTGDPTQDYRNVMMLLEVISAVSSASELEPLIRLVLDKTIQITDAERGILLLADSKEGLKVCLARDCHFSDLSLVSDFSHQIPLRVATSGIPVCLTDLGAQDLPEGVTKSVRAHGLRTVMCVPLPVKGRVLGVLYVDSHAGARRYSEANLAFLEALGKQIALALESATLAEERRRLEEERRRRLEEENLRLRSCLESRQILRGESETMQQVFAAVNKVARTDATVLILGESGTGKESISRTIHELSPRREKPCVIVNCGAIPVNLLETELFGHERGAFTGAHAQKLGRFEIAQGGTVFLDEVGELPLSLQVKLLRVLQEREIERVGGTGTIRVNVRIIAATNHDLGEMVRKGNFREDLFYRLNVVSIHLPPLRRRYADILPLGNFFLAKFRDQFHKGVRGFSEEAKRALLGYSWPGNVRELEHKVERAVIMAEGEWVHPQDLALEGIIGEGPLDADRARSLVGAASGPTAAGFSVQTASGALPSRPEVGIPLAEAMELVDQLVRIWVERSPQRSFWDAILDPLAARVTEKAFQLSSEKKAQAARLMGTDRNKVRRTLARTERAAEIAEELSRISAELPGLFARLCSAVEQELIRRDQVPGDSVDFPDLLQEIEHRSIAACVGRARGNISRAASLLGLSRATVRTRYQECRKDTLDRPLP